MLGVLIVICSALFYRVMFDDYLFLSSDSLSAKSVSQGIDIANEKYGEYPIWMPWMFGGLPSTHSMQNVSEYYFPHQIISAIKLLGIPWFWNFILHFLFCGYGMYILLKKLKLGFYPSLLGASCFMVTPWMVVNIVHGHGSQVMTAAYLPWVMWATIKLKDRPSIRNISILALLIGLQLQRGHVQIAYYSWIVMAGYIIYDYMLSRKIDIRFLSRWIISSIIGLCMSLWIYIPLLNYTPYSGRSIPKWINSATDWSLHPYEMLTIILPSSYGFGDSSYFGYMPFTNFPNYAGCLILILAILSFYHNNHNKIIYFFLSLCVFSTVVSFGKYFFFYEFLFDWLPYFNKFRVPSMILVIFQFSILVLASMGFNNLLDKIKEVDYNKSLLRVILIISGAIILISLLRYLFNDFSHKQFSDPAVNMMINEYRLSIIKNDVIIISILVTVFISSIIAVMNKKISIVIFSIGCLFFSIADIYLVDKKIINPKSPYSPSVIKHNKYLDAQLKDDDIINFLNSDKSKYRVLPIGELSDNRLVAFNIESVTGYHPAKLASYELLDKNVGMNYNILKMMNVKYLLSTQKFPEDQALDLSLKRVKSGKYYNNFQYRDVYVYEYLKLGERVQFLSNIHFVESRNEGYDLLKKPDFNIFNDSFISKYDYENYFKSISYNENSTLYIKDWSPNRITMEINAVGGVDEHHFILLSEIYFPYGWSISGLDNIKIIEVNNLLRGFFVPSGDNEITLVFEPVDIKYGAIITYSSLLLILFMFLISYRKDFDERI